MGSTWATALVSWLFAATVCAQHSPYSLQSAVDALHRREALMALHEYENNHAQQQQPIHEPMMSYYNEGPPSSELRRQQEINALLSRYLDSEDEAANGNAYNGLDFSDDDQQYFEERKRSAFRERGESPSQSAFRERESQADLAAEFLQEIDHERNVEREQRYKDTLRKLWDKYQQQENEIEDDLFNDAQQLKPSSARMSHGQFVLQREDLPDYIQDVAQKRNLVMPWLPIVRKRFPVAKRSPPPADHKQMSSAASGTDEKVAHDLQAIFNAAPAGIESHEHKAKRSSEQTDSATTTGKPEPEVESSSTPGSITNKPATSSSKTHKHDHNDNHDLDHDGYLAEHAHDHDEHDHEDEHEHDHEHDHEHEHEHDHDHEHEHDHDEDEDDESGADDDDDDRKKKRSAPINVKKRANLEVLKEDQILPGDLSDFKRKKSVEWSKYFGIDRRKKSTEWAKGDQAALTLQDYAPTHFRNHDQVVARPSNDLSEKNLDNMDMKLKTIEDLIIEETIKYTGAHEGINNPEEIQKLKDHVISRLATAYSLEKMRRALDKLKQSVDNERHLERNNIEESSSNNDAAGDQPASNFDGKEKRVAAKKEKAQFDNNQHSVDSATEKVVNEVVNNSFDEDNEDKKKKKNSVRPLPRMDKRPSYGRLEPSLNGIQYDLPGLDGYQQEGLSECPLLDAMETRCRGIDLLSGDMHQELLPVCGVHQLCYLCGTSQSSCDYQYLSEADALCGHNKECLAAARSALMILRGSPGPEMGPRECARNSCLRQALQEIGAL